MQVPEPTSANRTDRNDALTTAVRALFHRARTGTLTDDDVLPLPLRLPTAKAQRMENAIETIYRNKAAFEHSFKDHGAQFRVFRDFTAGEVILDVGAHWGYSAVAARHQGCTAHIVSIEALATNSPALERLKQIDPNYDYLIAAASDAAERIRLYIPTFNDKPNTGLATSGKTLDEHIASFWLGTIAASARHDGTDRVALAYTDVDAMTIDAVVDRLAGGRNVAAIKMDIEGHEGRALRGARRLLAEHKPLLMIEQGNRDPDVVAEMTAHGYFYCVIRNGRLVPQSEQAMETDGFWIHPVHVPRYESMGILGEPGADAASATMPSAAAFRAQLGSAVHDLGMSADPRSQVREIVPAPVLCPDPESSVRFFPLDLEITGKPAGRSELGAPYTFVDFFAFDGADFAYMVDRSLRRCSPNKREIRVCQDADLGTRMRYLLAAAQRAAKDRDGPRLKGLLGARALYFLWRIAHKLHARPAIQVFDALIGRYTRCLHWLHAERLRDRHLLLMALAEANRSGLNRQR